MQNLTVKFSTDKIGAAYSVYKSCAWLVQERYKKHGFIPATEHFLECPRAIGFPEIDYSNFKNLWETVGLLEPDTLPDNKTLLKFLQEEINIDDYLEKMTAYKKELEKFWGRVSKKFYRTFYALYPEFSSKRIVVNVFSVPFGSLCGFAAPEDLFEKFLEGYIYLRIDMPPEQLIEGILSALLSKSLLENYSWSQKEAIIDFLVDRVLINNVNRDQHYKTTQIIEEKEINQNLLSNSKKFIESLKISLVPLFKLEDEKVIYCDKKLTQLYTPEERKLLIQIIKKDNHILTYNEIADIIWREQSSEKFSLWAISKRIQRLRKKLSEDGIPDSAIMTVRGVGYYLNS